MAISPTGLNPEYISMNRQYNPAHVLSINKQSTIVENGFINKLNNDIDRLDFKANNQVNNNAVPSLQHFLPKNNPFTQTIPVDSSIYVDMNIFKTVPKELKEDIEKLENHTAKAKKALTVLSPIPSFRRVMSVPDSIHDENWGRVVGTLGLAALNMPADLRDSVKLGMAEISSIKNGSGPIKAQVNQNFLGGTLLNEWRKKNQWLDKILKPIDKYDKTVSETNFGKWINDKFKINSKKARFNSGITNLRGRIFEGNIFQRTAGCSLMRVSLIGVALSSLFEIPALYKAATVEGNILTKTKSFTKQLCKSGSFIGLNTIAIAVGGGLAMAAGMGVLAALGLSAGGAALALYGSNKLNEQIDKLFA